MNLTAAATYCLDYTTFVPVKSPRSPKSFKLSCMMEIVADKADPCLLEESLPCAPMRALLFTADSSVSPASMRALVDFMRSYCRLVGLFTHELIGW